MKNKSILDAERILFTKCKIKKCRVSNKAIFISQNDQWLKNRIQKIS